MTHTFAEQADVHQSTGANLTTYTPVCSCGWKGYGVASYNDDLFFILEKQRAHHLRISATTTKGVKDGR